MEFVTHDSRQLVLIFNRLFSASHQTLLVGGATEPLYQPASQLDSYHRIFFREDFFASALHEISHWCVAGPRRRTLIDFGYWYEPDGRNTQQQAHFELVEVKPQALEWIFSVAADYPFRLSMDNLSGEEFDREPFKRHVYGQALLYRKKLPPRAQSFAQALMAFYGTIVCEQAFNPEDI